MPTTTTTPAPDSRPEAPPAAQAPSPWARLLHLASQTLRRASPLHRREITQRRRELLSACALDDPIAFDASLAALSLASAKAGVPLEAFQALNAALLDPLPDRFLALLARGADPNLHSPGHNPIIYDAIALGRDDAIRALIDAGADLGARSVEQDLSGLPPGLTPLISAAAHASLHALKALIDAGADLDARAPDGHTAFTRALWRSNPVKPRPYCEGKACADALLLAGADPSISPHNDSPLSLSIQANHPELARLLVELCPDPAAWLAGNSAYFSVGFNSDSRPLLDEIIQLADQRAELLAERRQIAQATRAPQTPLSLPSAPARSRRL